MTMKAEDVAYEQEMARARLPKSNPDRLTYSEATKRALAAYDEAKKERKKR